MVKIDMHSLEGNIKTEVFLSFRNVLNLCAQMPHSELTLTE